MLRSGGRHIALLVAAVVVLPNCGDGGSKTGAGGSATTPLDAPAAIDIVVTDKAFQMPTELEAEPVSLTLSNEGKQVHRAYFARLNDDVTESDFRKALSKGPDALFPILTLAGDIPDLKPGGSDGITMLFPEGNYVVIDPEVKGPPPFQLFTVTPATGPPVEEPSSDYAIETGEFYFKITEPISGKATVEISNVGEQNHEVGIGKGPHGKDGEVTTIFAPAPGGKLWTEVNLKPGKYTLVCFLPDPKTNKPHFKLGMELPFEVK